MLVPHLVQIVAIVWVAEFSDLIELISEHVLIVDVVEVNEEVDLVDSSLNEVSRCLYCEGCLPNSWIPIQEKEGQIGLPYLLHEFVKLPLPSHH